MRREAGFWIGNPSIRVGYCGAGAREVAEEILRARFLLPVIATCKEPFNSCLAEYKIIACQAISVS